MDLMDPTITGPGVHLMPEWSHKLPRPKDVLDTIPGSLGKPEWDDIAKTVVHYSVVHNAWCGVAWTQLCEDLRKRFKPYEFMGIKGDIELMVQIGLLEVPRHKAWHSRWLNAFEPQIIRPTQSLLDAIQTNSRSKAEE